MSWTTGTQAELLAANTTIPSAYASFTSAQYVGPAVATNANPYLPANFFLGNQGVGKTLYVKAFGIAGTTSTPTFTIGVSLNTTSGTYNGSGVAAVTPSITMPSGITNEPWELDVLITCTGTGSSGVLLADGLFKLYESATAIAGFRCSSSTANPNTGLTISTEVAYYVEPFASFGSSSASNLVNVYSWAVMGLN